MLPRSNQRTAPLVAHEPDYLLLLTVGALVASGLVMVYSASFVEAFVLHRSQFYYIFRQVIGAMIGTAALIFAMNTPYPIWRRFSVPLMGGALFLLVLVLILPESMTMVNGSRSWIRLQGGLFSVQPSEIAKLAVIVYFADWLSRRGGHVGNVTYGLLPFALMLGMVCGLVILEPDLGTMVVILLIGGIIYFAAGANLLHILAAAIVGGVAYWLILYGFDSNNGRILAFRDPWQFYDSYGYQPIHALYALASGGIFGAGLGQSRQKFQWLPQAHTDSIYAIVGEELGLIGTLLMLVAFAIIAYRGYRIACRLADPFAALVAVGITSWLVFQALLNMAVTTSLVPFTGLTLPFISYGSTSLIMSMLSAGILLNLSRYAADVQPEEQMHDQRARRSPAPRASGTGAWAPAVAALPVWWGHWRPRLPRFGRRRSVRQPPRRSPRRVRS